VTALRFGILLPTREAVLHHGGDPARLLRQAEATEALGFDSVWVGDSLLARPRLEPLTLLASLATLTSRVTLGTAVLLPALRHPVLLAHSVATLDRLAGGRLVLGVGAAGRLPSTELELAAVGVPMRQRISRMAESLELCRALWSGPVGGWSSRHWELGPTDLLPRPAQPGGPPLWLGGDAPATLERVGRLFDGWFPFTPSPEGYGRGLATVRKIAGAAGRDPKALTPGVYLNVAIDRNPDRALEAQRSYLESYYGMPYETMAGIQASHAGTVETALAWMRRYVEAGATHVVVRPTVSEPSAQLDSLAEVTSRLRSAFEGGGSQAGEEVTL
jgi:alkanesulfonate monooxygenase SsuD/methylene tetrahydromethanopterin reductase-like flavin-dependent oxidoreductase (luciferase family)